MVNINVEGDFKNNTFNHIEGDLYNVEGKKKRIIEILYNSLVTL